MSKGKKKENHLKTFNEHYENRATDRPKQHWVVTDVVNGVLGDYTAPRKEATDARAIKV